MRAEVQTKSCDGKWKLCYPYIKGKRIALGNAMASGTHTFIHVLPLLMPASSPEAKRKGHGKYLFQVKRKTKKNLSLNQQLSFFDIPSLKLRGN